MRHFRSPLKMNCRAASRRRPRRKRRSTSSDTPGRACAGQACDTASARARVAIRGGSAAAPRRGVAAASASNSWVSTLPLGKSGRRSIDAACATDGIGVGNDCCSASAQAAIKLRIAAILRDDEAEKESALRRRYQPRLLRGDAVEVPAKRILDFRRPRRAPRIFTCRSRRPTMRNSEIAIEMGEITRRQHAKVGIRGVRSRASRLASSVFPYAQRDVRATDDEFPDLAWCNRIAGVIDDGVALARKQVADRQSTVARASRRDEPLAGVAFGLSIGDAEMATDWRKGAPLHEVRPGNALAISPDNAQMREGIDAAVELEQHPEQRGARPSES